MYLFRDRKTTLSRHLPSLIKGFDAIPIKIAASRCGRYHKTNFWSLSGEAKKTLWRANGILKNKVTGLNNTWLQNIRTLQWWRRRGICERTDTEINGASWSAPQKKTCIHIINGSLTMGQRQSFQQTAPLTRDIHMQKNESRHTS